MDNEIREMRLKESLKLVKENIANAQTKDKRDALYEELNKLQTEANTLKTGIIFTENGKSKAICRDYSIDCEANTKLKRLTRD